MSSPFISKLWSLIFWSLKFEFWGGVPVDHTIECKFLWRPPFWNWILRPPSSQPPNYTLIFILLKRSLQGHKLSCWEKGFAVELFNRTCLSDPYKWEWERRVCLMRSERGGGHAEPKRGNLVSSLNRDHYYLLCVGSCLSVCTLSDSML